MTIFESQAKAYDHDSQTKLYKLLDLLNGGGIFAATTDTFFCFKLNANLFGSFVLSLVMMITSR